MAEFQTPLKSVVGERTANAFTKAFGWEKPTVETLLRHYPYRYVKRGELTPLSEVIPGELATIAGVVKSVVLRHSKSNRKMQWVEVVVNDGAGNITAKFFNQRWRLNSTKPGMWGIFSGEIEAFKEQLQLTHPEMVLFGDEASTEEQIEKFNGTYIPFYHSRGKISSEKIRKSVELVLANLDPIPDFLPVDLLKKNSFPDLDTAVRELHQKTGENELKQALARLKFDEAYLLQLHLLKRKMEAQKIQTIVRPTLNHNLLKTFEAKLPFNYTPGQKEVMEEIEKDLFSTSPMHRLLQGEVGSGKTVVAVRSILQIAQTGAQSALLAPTEVLATQHYLTIQRLLGDLAQGGTLLGSQDGIRIELLTGSTPAKKRKEILTALQNNEIQLLIGTHALISDGVEFADLALVVVDEQHRFGVEQRDALRMKAKYPPHVLVMTATPIPRTVAMTFFGDLEVSTLAGLPSNRQPIETHLINEKIKPTFVNRAWERVKEEVLKGRQAYVVTSRIGLEHSSEQLTPELLEFAKTYNLLNAEEQITKDDNPTSLYELYETLTAGPFANLKVGILHGAMPAIEKESVMAAFAAGEISVLFATTVIEVGVDVPNATIMVIYDADRFGISQLHQLRGRIGRGSEKSIALLITKADINTPTYARLEAVAGSTDGFYLAQVDLEYRREGNILGTAQSGSKSMLRLLRVVEDLEVIESARAAALETLNSDPALGQSYELKIQLELIAQEEASAYLEKS